MKNLQLMKRIALPIALISAVLPVALVGCSGGTNPLFPGGPNPTPTPITPTPIALKPATFKLANGQSVTLTGTQTGNQLSGTLKVAAKTTLKARITANATFPFQITAGDYSYIGTVTPPRSFDINGNFGSFGSFHMTGLLPTLTQDGSFSLTTNGVTDSGVIPRPGTPTATATPTTPPVGGGYNLTGSLAVSNVAAGGKVITSPFNTFNYKPQTGELVNASASGTQSLSFGASTENLAGNGVRRDISIALSSAFATGTLQQVPFSMGQRIVLGQNFSELVQYSQVAVNGTSIGFTIWRAISGEVVVRAIGTNSATVELVNVRMRGLTTSGNVDTAAGEFTFNGTLTATGLTVTTQ